MSLKLCCISYSMRESWLLNGIEILKIDARLESTDCDAIAFVLVQVIGTLLWLSLSQEKAFRQRLVTETKRLTLKYWQSYFPSELKPPNETTLADS